MDRNEFNEIRKELGKTQNELSKILCVSVKAIQSFEQGWRNIPVSIEREMMLLHALVKTSERDDEPKTCWEMVDCPEDWRRRCIVGELNIKHFCWYINGTYCHGKYKKNWQEKIKVCKECDVFRNMISNSYT